MAQSIGDGSFSPHQSGNEQQAKRENILTVSRFYHSKLARYILWFRLFRSSQDSLASYILSLERTLKKIETINILM
jgi:hypothetical protein